MKMLFARRVFAIARAEGQYLLREPRTLLVIFVQPMMLLILYGYAISFDLHDLPFAVLDQDRTGASRQFVAALNAGGEGRVLALRGYLDGPEQIAPLLANGQARFVLVIPPGFAREIVAGG